MEFIRGTGINSLYQSDGERLCDGADGIVGVLDSYNHVVCARWGLSVHLYFIDGSCLCEEEWVRATSASALRTATAEDVWVKIRCFGGGSAVCRICASIKVGTGDTIQSLLAVCVQIDAGCWNLAASAAN